MITLRLKTRISKQELDQKIGKLVTDEDYNVLLTRAARILKPDGRPLCVYLPGAVREAMDAAHPTLRTIRLSSDNRGLASGSKRIHAGGNRTRAMPVASGILGAMDPAPNRAYCRLTAYSREHLDRWTALFPLLNAVARCFAENVPDRHAAQWRYCQQTNPDWIVPGTPFTTVTINNTYATGVHTDKGDLDEGFSCLTVARSGLYSGGVLVFPEYRMGVDMKHGDLILMDAHDWHGNTRIEKHEEAAERISVVCYYRSEMLRCGSMSEEDAKREQQTRSKIGV